jgi:excisionase family DNA binding protein
MEMKLLLSPDEACAALGVRRSTLYKMLDSREIASIRVGRLRRIPLERLREWIDKQLSAQGVDQGAPGYAEAHAVES